MARIIDRERYRELRRAGGTLTREEMDAGYHFCPEMDYDIVGPGYSHFMMPDGKCACGFKDAWREAEDASVDNRHGDSE